MFVKAAKFDICTPFNSGIFPGTTELIKGIIYALLKFDDSGSNSYYGIF